MRLDIKNLKATYIFNTLAILILLATVFIYNEFEKTKEIVSKTNIVMNLEYIDNISDNILEFIKKDLDDRTLYDFLDSDEKNIDKLENYLKIFVTDRYKYIYLVDKKDLNATRFRFLLDGSKNVEDKSEFLEPFFPINIEKFNKAYNSASVIYFQHKDDTKLWMTYLKPLVIKDKVMAVLVFDFSLKEHSIILSVLNKLSLSFRYGFLFLLVIFLVILWFSFIDLKREKIKEEINKKLKSKSLQLKELNDSLEDKIKEEIEKNRLKDQQLLEQSRLAQMGEMISMIAHQWRQPLNAISSMSTSIKVKLAVGKVDDEFLNIASDKISYSSQYLSQTIDDFRNFYKSEKNIQETSFEEILKDVIKIIGVSLENKNIKLETKINSHEMFNTYANELKQVIMNLIKNAEDIFVEENIQDGSISIEIFEDEEYHVLSVKDNAGGIDENIIGKIFDPYFSTKKQKDGTGLGLYMSKIIVQDHCQGELSVSNIEGGVCFTIKVPNIKFI